MTLIFKLINMRRGSGHEGQLFSIYQKRQIIDKRRSPLAKSKPKVRPTQHNEGLANIKKMKSRKSVSFTHTKSHESSTNQTVKNKKNKSNHKTKIGNLKKYEKEIMEILNASASIIQREWRKYLLKKRLKDKQKQELFYKKEQIEVKNVQRQNQQPCVSIATQELSEGFNNQKYFSCNSINSQKKIQINTFSKNIFSFNSSEKKIIQKLEIQDEEPIDGIAVQKKSFKHTKSNSDGIESKNRQIVETKVPQKKIMKFQGKTIDLMIENQKNKKKYQEQYVHNDKRMMEKMIRKYERKLQQKKLKQILSLENRLGNNTVTFRSYQKTLQEIREDHRQKLSLIKFKKDKIFANWEQIWEIYQKTTAEDSKPQLLPINLSGSDFSLDSFSCKSNNGSGIGQDYIIPQQRQEKQINFAKCKRQQILITQSKSDEDFVKEQGKELSQIEYIRQKSEQNVIIQVNNCEMELQSPRTPRKGSKQNNYCPIHPKIQFINSWLLQVSHYALDNHANQIFQRLVNVQQPNSFVLLSYCKERCQWNKQYQAITQKIFKQFEYFSIKNLTQHNQIFQECKDSYSALVLTFHKCLFDCLNEMLLDELIYGRKWLIYPWNNSFRLKKIIVSDHAKQCLERAINRVSTLSDYELYPINKAYKYGTENQELHQNLICFEEIKALPLDYDAELAFCLISISTGLIEDIIHQQVHQIKAVFDHFF